MKVATLYVLALLLVTSFCTQAVQENNQEDLTLSQGRLHTIKPFLQAVGGVSLLVVSYESAGIAKVLFTLSQETAEFSDLIAAFPRVGAVGFFGTALLSGGLGFYLFYKGLKNYCNNR
jgi:drug/metabolite transporter (DMT)-like permease